MREVIERIAFVARDDKKIDKRSGVSQRLPISCMENVHFECRATGDSAWRDANVVPRLSDVYAAMPAITGKLELEYEGEMKGADNVARELIRTAVAKTYDDYFNGANMNQVVQWFDLGGEIQLADSSAAATCANLLQGIQGLMEKITKLNVGPKDARRDPGFGGRIHSRRAACPQTYWTQRRTGFHGWRETAQARRETVCTRRTAHAWKKAIQLELGVATRELANSCSKATSCFS